MLFSVAENQLEDGDQDEAMVAVERSLTLFRELEDNTGISDAMRLMVHAYRAKADELRNVGDGAGADELIDKAEELAEEELARFKDLDDARGQASMLLSLAEAGCAFRGSGKRDDALAAAEEARAIFHEIGDCKMEALASQMISEVLYRKRNVRGSKQAAEEAIDLYKSIDDKKGQAQAIHVMASADVRAGALESALRSGRKALKLQQEAGDKKGQVSTLISMAEWHLQREDNRGAKSAAEAAIGLLQGLVTAKASSMWAAAMGMMAESYLVTNEWKQALEIAEQGVDRFRSSGEKKEHIRMLQHMIHAKSIGGDTEGALEAGYEALNLAREVGDKKVESVVLEEIAHTHLHANQLEKAKEVAKDAVLTLEELNIGHDEICCRLQVLGKILIWKDDYREAMDEIQKAKALAQKIDERNLEAFALSTACRVYGLIDDLEKGVKAGELAAEIFREEGDRRGEARAWEGLAEVQSALGDYASALRAGKKAEALTDELGDRRLLAKMKHSMATIHMQFEELEEANKAATEAVRLSRADDDMRGTVRMIFLALDVMCAQLMKLGNEEGKIRQFRQGCDKALRLAREAVGLSIRMNDRNLEAGSQYWIGSVHLLQGREKEVDQAADTALSIAREVNDKSVELRALGLKVQAHMLRNDMGQANTTLAEMAALADKEKDQQGQQLVQQLRDMMKSHVPREAPAAAPTAPAPGQAPAAAASVAQQQAFRGPDPMMVRNHIIAMVKNMTGSDDGVDGDTPLMESGIDSLASVELRTQLQQEFKVTLPSTVMFNYPTISGMTQLLVDECTNKGIAWGG